MNRTTAALLVLLTAMLLCGRASSQTALDEAKKHIGAQQYQQAIRLLLADRERARQNQGVAELDNLVGWSYFSLGMTREAEDYLNSAFINAEKEQNPEVKRLAANNLGILYFVEDNFDKSLFFFNNPAVRDTRTANQYRNLIADKRKEVEAERLTQAGITARFEQKFTKAIEFYDKALEMLPNDSRILEFKGYALYRLGKYGEAVVVLRQAYRADIGRNRSLLPLNLIKAYCAIGKDQQVLAIINSAQVSTTTLKLWWQQDKELQSVCAQSPALRQALNP
ncbi:MAG: tetratricopeptide repeat protein [Desulfopila sp.]